jgi:hypothetical protein
MAKRITEKPQTVIVPREPDRIYIYVRSWLLLNPVPYKWKLNRVMLDKIKNLPKSEQANQ